MFQKKVRQLANHCYIRLYKNRESMLKTAIFVLTITFLAGGATCQTLTRGPEPEFVNTVTFVNGKSPVQLEKQRVTMKTVRNASAVVVGIGKVKMIGTVKGEKSAVRVEASDTLHFLVRVSDNSKDPATVVNFARFQINVAKKNRFIEVESVKSFQADTDRDNVDFIQFTAKKYGTSSYLLAVVGLTPGEYTITLDGSRDLCQMFGVDDKTGK